LNVVLQRVGVQPEERSLFLRAGLCLAMLGAAAIALLNTAETLFLKRVGVEHLPVALMLSAGLLVLTTAVAGRFASGAPARWLPRLLAGLALAPLPFVFLGESGSPVVIGALLLVSRQVLAVGTLAFWLAMGSLVPARRAKQIFAPLAAGLTLGGIVGSFGSDPLARLFGVDGLIALCVVVLGSAAIFSSRLRRRGTRDLEGSLGAKPSPSASKAGVVDLLRTSRLFRLLAVALFCGGVLNPVLYFEFASVLDAATQGADGEQQMLDLYSQFRGWLSVALLVSQVWVSSFLYRHVGLPLAMAMWPAAYVLGLGWLGADFALVAAFATWGMAQVSEDGVSDSAARVLYNLFSDSVRNQATGLLEGPINRLGGLLGNAFVIAALAVGGAAWVGWAALPLGVFWLASALILWRAYPSLLVRASAEHGLVGAGIDRAILLDPATLRSLAGNLVDPDLRVSRAAIDLVIDAESARALELLAIAVEKAPEANRPSLVGAMLRIAELLPDDVSGSEDTVQALERTLRADPPLPADQRADIVRVYARLTRGEAVPQLVSRQAMRLLTRLLGDRVAPVRLAAMAELHRRGSPPPGMPDLDRALADALTASDALVRRAARQELRAMLQTQAVDGAWMSRFESLARHLDQRSDRAETAEALREVARHHGDRTAAVARDAIRFVEDRDPRVRGAVLAMLGHAGLSEEGPRLVSGLGSRSPEALAGAQEGLIALGPTAVLPLLVGLEFGGPARREAALLVLRELQVDAGTLEDLRKRQLEEIHLAVMHRAAVEDWVGAGAKLLRRRLAERVAEGLGALLDLLSALYEEPRLAELERRLRRMPSGREHDLLIEAIEALLSRRDREVVVPLLEPVGWPERADAAENALALACPEPDQLLSQLRESRDETVRLLTAAIALDGAAASGDPLSMPTAMEIAARLQDVAPFDRLSTQQLVKLADLMQEQKIAAGERICGAGDEGLGLYFVLSGEVELRRGSLVVEHVAAGSFFGELSTLDGVPRSSDAVAASDASLMRLDRDDLLGLLEEAPGLAIGLAQVLSARLRRMEDRLAAATSSSGDPT
jgi:hypothetical protein